MSVASLVVMAVVFAGPAPASGLGNICLVEVDEVPGAEVEVIIDALAIEARKWDVVFAAARRAELPSCDVTVTLAPRTEIATRTSLRVLALDTLEPLDRAPEIARTVASVVRADPTVGDLFGGDLPPFVPPAHAPGDGSATAPLTGTMAGGLELGPSGSAREVRASLGGSVVGVPGERALYGWIDVSVEVALVGAWLIASGGLHVSTPATFSDAEVEAQLTELGGQALIGLAWSPRPWRLSGALGLGVAYRWSSAAVDPGSVTYPAANLRHEDVVTSLVARVGVAWDVSSTWWWGLEVHGRRYVAGTDLVALAGRVRAPRGTIGAGLRIGVRL